MSSSHGQIFIQSFVLISNNFKTRRENTSCIKSKDQPHVLGVHVNVSWCCDSLIQEDVGSPQNRRVDHILDNGT